MAERPGQSPTSSRVDRLAERFGMTKESVEALLRSTHESYSKIGSEAILPPAEEAPKAPIEEAAAELGSVATPEPPKPVVSPRKGISAGLMASLLTILLIALGLALSFQHGCFKQREERVAKPVDTIQSLLNSAAKNASTPPQPPSNVPPSVVPPEALVVPREEPPGTSGKPSSSGITSEDQMESSTPRPFETRSNFEAEEKLADMRANGNTHARMKAVRRHGSVVYQIYSK